MTRAEIALIRDRIRACDYFMRLALQALDKQYPEKADREAEFCAEYADEVAELCRKFAAPVDNSAPPGG